MSIARSDIDLPGVPGIRRSRPQDATYVRALYPVPVHNGDLADTQVNQLHEHDGAGSAKTDDGHMQIPKRALTLFAKRETLMFNGYGEQVAGLYAGMDLKKFY